MTCHIVPQLFSNSAKNAGQSQLTHVFSAVCLSQSVLGQAWDKRGTVYKNRQWERTGSVLARSVHFE